MSDALTDIERDGKRTEKARQYFEAIVNYIGGNITGEDVWNAAHECDSISRGYRYPQSMFVSEVPDLLQGLDANFEAALRYIETSTKHYRIPMTPLDSRSTG